MRSIKRLVLLSGCFVLGLLLVACQKTDAGTEKKTQNQGTRDFEVIKADFLIGKSFNFGDSNDHVQKQLKNNGIEIQETNEFILDEVPRSTIVVKYDGMTIAYRFRQDALFSIGRTTNVEKAGVQKYWDLLGEPDEEVHDERDSDNAKYRYTDKKYYWRGIMDGHEVELIVSYWGWPKKYSVDFELND